MLDLADRLDATSHDVTWLFTPADAPFATLLPGRRCAPQVAGDLGARLDAGMRAAFAGGAGSVLVIGADAPHLPLATLDDAADALTAGADLVLGPALDGGYYLIGASAPVPTLLDDMSWSTDAVFTETMRRADALGLRVHVLPPLGDVDTVDDALALRAVITDDPALARTRAVLDEVLADY